MCQTSLTATAAPSRTRPPTSSARSTTGSPQATVPPRSPTPSKTGASRSPRKPLKHVDHPCRWGRHTVLYIATNPAYIAKRTYRRESWRVADRHAAILEGVEAQWDALVSEEQWWAVQRILSDPKRQTWRPGKGQHLLGGVARCGECGDPLYVHIDARRGIAPYYVCNRRGHVGVRVDWLNDYVEDRLVSWAADEKVRAHLW